MDGIPMLTEVEVRAKAAPERFERGRRYYMSGAVAEPRRLGDQLRGTVEAHRVSVTTAPTKIEHAHCTCDVAGERLCEHAVALILTWIHQPEAFENVDPLEARLEEYSREELVDLVRAMVEEAPKLIQTLEEPLTPPEAPVSGEAAGAPEPVEIHARVHALLQGEFPDASVLAERLRRLVDEARAQQAEEMWFAAGEIYTELLTQIARRYDELYDEGGAVAAVLDSCAEGLADCLDALPGGAELRGHWLATLLDVWLQDLQERGAGLVASAGEILVGTATPEEWTAIKKRVRDALTAEHNPVSWQVRERLVNLLVRRLEEEERPEEAERTLLALGTPTQRAYHWLDLGHVDAAVAVARKHFGPRPELVLRFADALIAAGAGEAAEAYVAELAEVEAQVTYLEWLVRYAEARGDLERIAERLEIYFAYAPSIQNYRALRDATLRSGRWEGIRIRALNALALREQWPAMMEIALYEGDAEHALNLLPRMSRRQFMRYAPQAAMVAADEMPEAALEVCRQQIEHLVAVGEPAAYRAVTELLLHIRKLYHRLGEPAEWEAYLGELRAGYRYREEFIAALDEAGLEQG